MNPDYVNQLREEARSNLIALIKRDGMSAFLNIKNECSDELDGVMRAILIACITSESVELYETFPLLHKYLTQCVVDEMETLAVEYLRIAMDKENKNVPNT